MYCYRLNGLWFLQPLTGNVARLAFVYIQDSLQEVSCNFCFSHVTLVFFQYIANVFGALIDNALAVDGSSCKLIWHALRVWQF